MALPLSTVEFYQPENVIEPPKHWSDSVLGFLIFIFGALSILLFLFSILTIYIAVTSSQTTCDGLCGTLYDVLSQSLLMIAPLLVLMTGACLLLTRRFVNKRRHLQGERLQKALLAAQAQAAQFAQTAWTGPDDAPIHVEQQPVPQVTPLPFEE